MKTGWHCMSEACPQTSRRVQFVQVEVSLNHPLLLLKRALPWEAITEAMIRHWRQHGKNVDGGPGLPWDVSLYVPLVVLMLIKLFDSRQMETYMAENMVARVFIGRHQDTEAQIRDHSNIARAYAALGQEGVEAVNALIIQQAHRFGFVDEGVLSADTTAQELPIGYANEPGILRGLAQRCGRAWRQLQTRGVQGLDTAQEQVETILRSVKEHHLFTQGKRDKREVLTRLLSEVGRLIGQTREIESALEPYTDRVIQSAGSKLLAMHEIIQVLMGQIVPWVSTGKVAADKIVHVGIPQARAIVRNKAGKKTEFGLAYLISRLGGGMCWGSGSWPMRTRDRCPSRRCGAIGPSLVRKPRRSWWSTIEEAIAPKLATYLPRRESSMWGCSPRASGPGRLPRQSETKFAASGVRPKG
jgi:hypothetical protein